MAVSISAGPTTSWRSTLIRLGPWRSMLAITGFSVVLSVFLVWLAAVPFGPPKCDTKTALTMAAAVPALVAPLASYFLTRLLFDLENTRAALLDMATRDSLTQIYNRRYLMERLDIEGDRAARTGQPISLIMIDADHFKHVNDTHGHQTGDVVLKHIASTCRDMLRAYDVLARYGGEEFVVLLPSTLLEEACQLAERIRLAIAAVRIDVGDGKSISVTISLGVSSLSPEKTSWKLLVDHADTALYEAKRAGRNRWAAW